MLKLRYTVKDIDIFQQIAYFHRMMKVRDPLKVERQAVDVVSRVLGEIPDIARMEIQSTGRDSGVDLLISFDFGGKRRVVAAEVKSSGHPRYVQGALFQLKRYVMEQHQPIIPVVVAPYLSEEVRALCTESSVGFLDFEGNAHITFPGFYLSRSVPGKPPAERRELRSLFKPKSAQVLRAMLREPHRHWRLVQLAEEAVVSLGHVSNVRNSLIEREWADVSGDGTFLSNPDALLDAWREAYVPPAGERHSFYTTLHGMAFEKSLYPAIAPRVDGQVMLASFSAANWLAPYARTSTHYFYADAAGADYLQKALKLSSAASGENVVVTVLDDTGLFQDGVKATPGLPCTSPVQTYLDLYVSGERGREAAEHLRREKMQWM